MGYTVAQLAKVASLIFAVNVITSFLAKASGFNLADAYFGSELTTSPEQRAALVGEWGLDQPIVVQFDLWWWNLLHGDLGTSLVFERPVTAVIGDALINLSMLLFIAWLASGLLGAGLGIVVEKSQERFLDWVISTVCHVLAAIPTFWFGIVLLLIFAVWLKWSPIGLSAPIGKALTETTPAEYLNHLVLPAATLSLIGVSTITIQTWTRLIEEQNSDYALFARSRGEISWQFIRRHGLRDSLMPSVTLQFGSINKIIGSPVPAESVFSYAGLGAVTVMAGTKGDLPLLTGITVISSAAVFLGNLCVNLLYPLIDPRIKETQLWRPC